MAKQKPTTVEAIHAEIDALINERAALEDGKRAELERALTALDKKLQEVQKGIRDERAALTTATDKAIGDGRQSIEAKLTDARKRLDEATAAAAKQNAASVATAKEEPPVEVKPK